MMSWGDSYKTLGRPKHRVKIPMRMARDDAYNWMTMDDKEDDNGNEGH